MLNNSPAEHLRSIGSRPYCDVPEGTLLQGNGGQGTFAKAAGGVANSLTHIAKISALLALPIGIVVLLSYLGDETAPLPSLDTSVTILLSVVSAAFLFITFLAVSAFLLPFYRLLDKGFTRKRVYLSEARCQRASQHRLLPEPLAMYLSEFGHFATAVCAFGVYLSGHERLTLAVLFTGLGFWFTYSGLPKFRSTPERKRSKSDVAMGMLSDFAYSCLSLTLICPLVYVFAKRAIPDGHDVWMAVIVLGVPLLIHALCFVIVTGWRPALIAYCILVVTMAMLGPGLPFLGGTTLSFLRLGGNIPVSMMLKTYGGTTAVSGTEELTGCLVIMTGADVIFRPTARRSDCSLHPSWWFNRMQKQDWGTYTKVDRYPRADILRISGFPTYCGTIDGIPDPSCDAEQK